MFFSGPVLRVVDLTNRSVNEVGRDLGVDVGLLRYQLVAAHDGGTHLRPVKAALGESVDVPRWWCLLQCLHHLGCGGTVKDVREARGLPQGKKKLPTWRLEEVITNSTPLLYFVKVNYSFLLGLLAPVPVWFLAKRYPEKKWIRLINMPVLIAGAGGMPPVRAVNYLMWGTVGVFFNLYIYKKYKGWWARHNYILSAGLDAGVAFMGTLCYFTLQMKNEANGVTWWGASLDDHCPLAHCPTAPGIKAEGCPVFH